jgi:hypothetical protein
MERESLLRLRWTGDEFIYSEDFGVGNYNNIFMFEKRFYEKLTIF